MENLTAAAATAYRTVARTTDEALLPLLAEIDHLEAKRRRLFDAADEADQRRSGRGDHLRAQGAEIAPQLKELREAAAPLKAIAAAGSWTRFVLVPAGHLHRGTGCSTLRISTALYIMPEYSGAEETEVVELAGERACTVCFPSAPVNRPSMLPVHVKEREQAAAEAAEKAAKRNAAKAAAILTEDGKVAFKSQRAAENALSQELGSAVYFASWHAEVGAPQVGIPMAPNPESFEDHTARQQGNIEGALDSARRIVALLQANGVETEALVAKKLAAKVKEANKWGAKVAELAL